MSNYVSTWEKEYNEGFPAYASGRTKKLYKKYQKLDGQITQFLNLSKTKWDEDETHRFLQMLNQRAIFHDEIIDSEFSDYNRFVSKYHNNEKLNSL